MLHATVTKLSKGKNLLDKIISVMEGDSHKSAKTVDVIAPKRHPSK